MEDYEVQCDADTLLKADEIRKDKSRLDAAMKFLDKKVKAIRSLDDLRKKASNVMSGKDEDEDESEDDKGTVKIEIEINQKENLDTDEDKLAKQEMKIMDKKSKEMFKNADRDEY